ncbi:hypothetical protein BW687_006295 [Pseudomonas graminis]|uniref:hypothetical protein n=1 Tax=Pseudomonas graminis TaxID=158627 RepID=UPI00234A3303|nr:hypothetical protein [Pseudomonas graminis]MDC6379790.1 hypothetical protein [Pseudomonas graminis]
MIGDYQYYFAALKRLVDDCPLIIPGGSTINYDNVALEAGRKKGAIRRERKGLSALRQAIDDAAEEQRARITPQNRFKKANDMADKYKALWEQSLGRELCLARQIRELQNEIRSLEKRIPLRVIK